MMWKSFLVLGILLISIGFVIGDVYLAVPSLNNPKPAVSNQTANGKVTIDASGSYVVKKDSAGVVECLAGECPATTKFFTEEGNPVNVLNHNLKQLDVNEVEFIWELDGEKLPAKRGDEDRAYVFDEFYMPSDNYYWVKLTMNYYDDELVLAGSSFEFPFKVSYEKTACSPDGEWVAIGGGSPWPEPGCYINGVGTCCPEDYECNIVTKQCVGSLINICADYDNEEDCEDDIAGVALDSISEKWEGGKTCPDSLGYDENDCLQHLSDCRCEWIVDEDGNENCDSKVNISISNLCEDDFYYPNIGTCHYSESTSNTCDGEGYLIYSWTGEFIWDEENDDEDGGFCFDNGGECDISTDGELHYDPEGRAEICEEGGSVSTPCPASVKMPFFGFWQLVISLIGVVLVYCFVGWEKR